MKLYKGKFTQIKAYFTYNRNINNPKSLTKQLTNQDIRKRPKLQKLVNKLSIKKRELSNILDQIGKEDEIFNDENLISNIKIETIEDTLDKNQAYNEGDKSFISKKTTKTNSSFNNLRKYNKKMKYFKQNRNKIKNMTINNDTLELNCNKIPFSSDISKISLTKKKQNHSKQSSRTKIHKMKNKNINIKNVDQFINKPNDNHKNENHDFIISPLSKHSPIKLKYRHKLLKKRDFCGSQRSLLLKINNNDSISMTSNSKNEISKSFINATKTIQPKQLSYMHFPGKSIIKNQEKVIIELQKLFGDRLQLSNDTYQNMTDLDKINCINFLLETIKEMNNINKTNKSKIDGYRELNENKEKQIKEQKTEIKGLKKEINKLNKLVRANTQLNKKYEQNVESLKSQLEKEKEKNKSLVKDRGKSTSKMINSYINLKLKNEKTAIKNKHKRINRSQEVIQKANIFINREKNEINNTNVNNKNENINQNNINVKTNINIIIKDKEQIKDNSSLNQKEQTKENN